MDITVENLESAVSQFYNSDSAVQAQAHQWLTNVQSSPAAWGVVWELLQPNRSREGQFFAATTLHLKIMKNWNQVPPDQYENLKNKLLQTIVQYSIGPDLILNRLCIALSALLIQMTPRYWKDSIGDLLTMFRPENLPSVSPQRVIWILFEVLTFIPEEFQSMLLSSTHRTYVRNELEKHSEKVISLINSALGSEEVREAAAKAAAAWLQFGVSLPSCLNIASSLVAVIRSKTNDITETCEHELEALNHMVTHPDTYKFPACVLQLLSLILQLTADVKSSGNEEVMTNIYKLLIAIGETHPRLLLDGLKSPQSYENVKSLISHLLDCTATPGDYPKDETRSQLVLSFWYLLQDEMINLEKDDLEYTSSYLVPVYERLCEVLLHKSKLPSDIDSLSSADQELIRIYRQDISDTIVYCYHVARDHLIRLLVRCQREARSWQEAEAVLHITLALAETATAQDDETVIGLLVNTPPEYLNHRVINALNQAVGAYAEWLGNALPQLIPRLVASLLSPETATSATMALKDITRERTTSLEPYAAGLLAACQEALNKGHLKQAECVRLMYSIGRLLSVIPYNHMLATLEPLLSNYASDIQQMVSQPQMKGNLILRLKMLSTLCSSLYASEVGPDPPAFLVLTRLLPVLSGVSQACASDRAVIEEVCHFLQTAVSNAITTKKEKEVLVPIISLGAHCYASQPNKQALDLVRQMCILYSKEKTESLHQLLASVTQVTVQVNQALPPDVLQAYFQLLTSVVKKSPFLLSPSVDVHHIFNFATDSLMVAETPVVKAAGSFLVALIATSMEDQYAPAFARPIENCGHHLVATMLICIAGCTPMSGLDIFADIILALNKRFLELFPQWLKGGLDRLPKPDPAQKEKFSKMVIREKAVKRKLIETIKEFALISRELVTIDYNH
ncbi:unnamed protein product [Nezara viridula]|uniref:Importin-13 n=1 Tax=Nezara viridula TaxID=85310 RepID=A0A9P0H1F0_NEZVI|nr:unnamed protein product [Nezara viridula]